jgi:RNA polymerase sigma factor (sigma-70 family)
MLVGRINKHYNDYQDREVLRLLGSLPITGHLIPQHYIEDDIEYETVDPETIEDLIEYKTAEDIYEEAQLQMLIKDTLDSMTPRESKILKLRFGIEMVEDFTLEQIAIAFNVTRERIRQIEAKALRKMRHPTRSTKLLGEPITLWDIATELPPERDDEEWGWSEAQEEWHQAKLEVWRERTTEARNKMEEAYKNLKGLV